MKISMSWEQGLDLWSKLLSYRDTVESKELDTMIGKIEKKIFDF